MWLLIYYRWYTTNWLWVFILPSDHRLRGIHSYHFFHPRAKPWYQQGTLAVLKDSFSVSAFAWVLFSTTFKDFFLYHGPGRGLLDAHSTSSSQLSIHPPLESSTHSPYRFLSYLFPMMVLDPSYPFCQKGTRVSLVCHTKWYFELTFCS